MVRGVREVSLNIGKGVYTFSTGVSVEAMDRVKAMIDEACGEVSGGARQEDILALACLRLAYSLDAVNEKLRGVLSVMDGRE